MKFDLMTGNMRWQDSAALAASLQSAGFSRDAVHGDQPGAVDDDRRSGHRRTRA